MPVLEISMQTRKTIVVERLLSITLGDLRTVGLLQKSIGSKSLPVTIKKFDGLSVHSYCINITCTIQEENSYVEFDFEINNVPVYNRVELAQIWNALTGSYSLLFKCPLTSSICRKLYLYQNRFVSRKGIANGYYMRNTIPVSRRHGFDEMKHTLLLRKKIAERGLKNYRTHYANNLTKKHLKVMQAYNDLQNR